MVLEILAERSNSHSRGRLNVSRLTVWVRFALATPAMARVTSVARREEVLQPEFDTKLPISHQGAPRDS